VYSSIEEQKKWLVYLLKNKTSTIPFPRIEGIGDIAFGFKEKNVCFARSNYVVRVHGNKDVWEIAKRIDEQIKKAQLLKEGEKSSIKMANKKLDKRKPNQNKIKQSKKRFSSEKWNSSQLSPRKEITIPRATFPKGNIGESETSNEEFRDMYIEIPINNNKYNDVEVHIFIFPNVSDAEDKFLILLDEWNFRPEFEMKDGPGRICYYVKNEGIMFLYGNVIYESEDQGMDHLAIAKKVADIIKKAPELKPGQKPKIYLEK